MEKEELKGQEPVRLSPGPAGPAGSRGSAALQRWLREAACDLLPLHLGCWDEMCCSVNWLSSKLAVGIGGDGQIRPNSDLIYCVFQERLPQGQQSPQCKNR